jgi:hypothetical protein
MRVIQILEALSASPDPVSLADLSRIVKTKSLLLHCGRRWRAQRAG